METTLNSRVSGNIGHCVLAGGIALKQLLILLLLMMLMMMMMM